MRIKVDTGELWSFYVSVANIKDQAAEECSEIDQMLKKSAEILQAKRKMLIQKLDELQSEEASLRRKLQNDEEENAAVKARLEQVQKEIEKLEQLCEEIQHAEKKLQVYEDLLQERMKGCSKAFCAGKRKISRYLSFVEQLDLENEISASTEGRENTNLEESSESQFLMTFRGKKFFCNDEELNMGENEQLNLARMDRGLPPIGADGLPVNLHHMQQSDRLGGIMELSESKHKSNHKTLHINTNDIPSGINRSSFESLKSAYWKKRATLYRRNHGL